MKKCPFCNAEIEENARFCLYCMNSLEEKELIETPKERKRWWPVLLAAVLVLVLAVICAIVLPKEKNLSDKTQGTPQNQTNLTSQHENDEDNAPSEDTTGSDENEQHTTPPVINEADISNSSGKNPTPTKPATKPNVNNTPNSNNNSGDNNPNGKEEEEIETPTTPDEDPIDTVASYLYRDAKYGDDFAVHADLENAVVIIGVSSPSSNGEYKIPETLDNKKVIAIMGLAFSDGAIKDTVKKVIVPSSVKTIWNNAFADCYNLTDIYFCGNSIYVEGNAFAPKSNRTGTLTIHCSYDCSDRNYRYYRNSAIYYEAQYEEWND